MLGIHSSLSPPKKGNDDHLLSLIPSIITDEISLLDSSPGCGKSARFSNCIVGPSYGVGSQELVLRAS